MNKELLNTVIAWLDCASNNLEDGCEGNGYCITINVDDLNKAEKSIKKAIEILKVMVNEDNSGNS